MPKSAVYEQVHTPLISEDPREYSDMEISFCVNCPQAAIPVDSRLEDHSVWS